MLSVLAQGYTVYAVAVRRDLDFMIWSQGPQASEHDRWENFRAVLKARALELLPPHVVALCATCKRIRTLVGFKLRVRRLGRSMLGNVWHARHLKIL